MLSKINLFRLTAAALSFLLTSTVFFEATSQVRFESGYYVSNTGDTVKCLIKNDDKQNNPKRFVYKTDEGSETKTAGIDDAVAFQTGPDNRYIRATVKIDQSEERVGQLGNNKEPEFIEQTVFLKVLSAGHGASLYGYKDQRVERFFVRKESGSIEPLIHKSYITPDNRVQENKTFIYQLIRTLQCDGLSMTEIQKTTYTRKDLTKLFAAYNRCSGETPAFAIKEKSNYDFNLYVRPGVRYSSLKAENFAYRLLNTEFKEAVSFRLGLEIEVIFPFNKNKWALVLEPSSLSYKSTGKIESYNANVQYSAVEIGTGIRHYFYLTQRSKVYLTASGIFGFVSDSYLTTRSSEGLKISSAPSAAISGGYAFGEQLRLEFRQDLKRELLHRYQAWNAAYTSSSIIIGYKVF